VWLSPLFRTPSGALDSAVRQLQPASAKSLFALGMRYIVHCQMLGAKGLHMPKASCCNGPFFATRWVR
jgi:hypothetical protein